MTDPLQRLRERTLMQWTPASCADALLKKTEMSP